MIRKLSDVELTKSMMSCDSECCLEPPLNFTNLSLLVAIWRTRPWSVINNLCGWLHIASAKSSSLKRNERPERKSRTSSQRDVSI